MTDATPAAVMAAAASQLLLVDVQERLAPAMSAPEPFLRNCTILLTAAAELGVPVSLSEQYPQGLGPTLPQLAALTESRPLEKVEFSCLRNPGLRAELSRPGRALVVAGIEAHVCVLQTVLDALGAGQTVFVVADAVDSRTPDNRERALRRIERAGGIVVSTEMVVFEWLGTAASPSFRRMSKLIR